jgi:hypothetical protein
MAVLNMIQQVGQADDIATVRPDHVADQTNMAAQRLVL